MGFKHAYPDDFSGLSENETIQKYVELDAEFKKWKRKLGKDTTSRNRLYELFLKVRILIIFYGRPS